MNTNLDDVPKKTLELILLEYKYESIDELYRDIGLGNDPKISLLKDSPPFAKVDSNNISYDIEGSEGLVMSYAKCCHPIPGDIIIGYASQGKGIVVHRKDCKSIKHTKGADKNIELRWSENVDNNFSVSIMIEVENVRGVLAEVSSIIAQSNHNIESVNYTDSRDTGHNRMLFVISVKNLRQLDKLLNKLSKIKNVLELREKELINEQSKIWIPNIDESKNLKRSMVSLASSNKYDLMNDIMSFGLHRIWKKQFIKLCIYSDKKNS